MDNDIVFKTILRRVVHKRYVFHYYIIIIYKNGNIIVSCREHYEFQKSLSLYNEILKIEDNIPIPQIYLNDIKQLLLQKPETSKRMNKIINYIKDIKERTKNRINNQKNLEKHLSILESELK
uniref:Uncharacterized protein n=1 Tax=viral metagenome TaxID=1070528 RepID=A0A6C0H4K5_9ZZZZ